MKKVLAILAILTLVIGGCKKSQNSSNAMTPTTIYCVYFEDHTRVKTFYACCKTKSEMQQKMIELREKNVEKSYTEEKNSCDECN
jgi:hypothetical protein